MDMFFSRVLFDCMVNVPPLTLAIEPLILPCFRTSSAAAAGEEFARRRTSMVCPGITSEAEAKRHKAHGELLSLSATSTVNIVVESTTVSPCAGLLSTMTAMLVIDVPDELLTVAESVCVPEE